MNGWKNYTTWNLALWVKNDASLYAIARKFKNFQAPWARLVLALNYRGITHTPDGVSYADKRASRKELNAMLREL